MGQSLGTPKAGIASVRGFRGKMPRLHQTDRCARGRFSPDPFDSKPAASALQRAAINTDQILAAGRDQILAPRGDQVLATSTVEKRRAQRRVIGSLIFWGG